MKKTRGIVTLLICISVLFFMTSFVFADDTTADDWITDGDTYVTSGNVGIGTSTPGVKLDIYEGSAGAAIKVESGLSSSGAVVRTKNDNSANGYFITYGSTYTSNIFGTSRAGYTFFGSDGAGSSGIKIGTINDTPVIFGQDNAEVMQINTSGNVGIGTTSSSQKLSVTDTLAVTDTSGSQYFLIGNQDSEGVNNPGMIVGTNGILRFGHGSSWSDKGGTFTENIRFTNAGNVGIGTTSPQSKLAVNGTITTKEVNVTEAGWSDFVFEDDYTLPSLDHVETFIKENKHLPDIPSAKEVKENGLPLAEIVTKQMQKIEELTLYLIEMKKENDEIKQELAELKKQLN